MTQKDIQQKNPHNVHKTIQMFCVSDLFYQPQTGVWCSSLAIPPGEENPLLLSHGFAEEIHKQRRLHTSNIQEMEMAKKQAKRDHEWKCSQEQEENRKGRKQLCIKIIPETQIYGCFKALGQKQLHSERKQSSSLRNLPGVPPIKFKHFEFEWMKPWVQKEGNKRAPSGHNCLVLSLVRK